MGLFLSFERLVPREDGSHHVCIAGLTETEAPNVETLIKVCALIISIKFLKFYVCFAVLTEFEVLNDKTD